MRKAIFVTALCTCCLLWIPSGAYAASHTQPGIEEPSDWNETMNPDEPGSDEPGSDEPLPALEKITDLKVQNRDNGASAMLTWTKNENAALYHIYRQSSGGNFIELGSTESAFYADDCIAKDTVYTYRVVPENEDGVQGEAAEIRLIPIPHTVKGIHTTSETKEKVLLEWDKSDFARQYIVYRKVSGGAYQKLAETEKISLQNREVVWGKKYRYKIIAVNENGEKGKEGLCDFRPTQAVNIAGQKYSYKQMVKDMKELNSLYSNYCRMDSIGKSVRGREIYDFAIGNPKAKKSILVICSLHAREYICSVTAMRQIENYLRNYNRKIGGVKPASALSNLQIHYIIMSNPDGTMISQTRNRRWKSNAHGVDLNRNFPAKPFKVGGHKGREGYSGSRALSEPESRAIANFTKKLKKWQALAGVINYHAMGQIIFGDCKSRTISGNTRKMYRIAKRLTGYRAATSYKSATPPSGGSYREYVMYRLKVPSITIEIGTTTAPCSYREYESAYRKNKYVVLKIANTLK